MNPAINPNHARPGPVVTLESLETRCLLSAAYAVPHAQGDADPGPVIKKIANVSLFVGQKLFTTGSFTDQDSANSWTATVNFGDGSGVQVLPLHSDKKFGLQHFYKSVGDFTVSVAVKDAEGKTGTRTFQVDVGGKAIENSLVDLLQKTSPDATSIAAELAAASTTNIAAVLEAQQALAKAISAALASNPLSAANAKRVALILLACVDSKTWTTATIDSEAAALQALFSAGGRDGALVDPVITDCGNMITAIQHS